MKDCNANGLNAGAFGSDGRVILAVGPGDGAGGAGLENSESGLGALADAAMAASSAVISGYDTYQQAENAVACSVAGPQDNNDHDNDQNNNDHDDDANRSDGPEPNPHPEVALDPDVDVEAIQESIDGQGHVTWRESHEQLYRNDTRPPSVIFNQGFAPQDPYNPDLDSYVNKSEHSAFVGTTNNEAFASKWGAKYVYDIDAPGGIDINQTFGPDSPFSHEDEIAFPGGVRPEYIKGVWEVKPDGSLGKYTANKNFKR
ncbi:scabin-related ADP-ribosyltransferase [Streptomyces sp. NPDC002004]